MIRPAQARDLPAIMEILHQNGLIQDGISYDDFSGVVLVAEREGEVIGMIQALPAKPYAVITEAAVAPEYHGKGYGMRLLSHLETVLMTMGIMAWAAYTGINNPTQDILGRLARPAGEGKGFVRILQ